MKDRPTPASYITIKIVISYKISRILFFFFSFFFFFFFCFTSVYPELKLSFYTRSKTEIFSFSQFFLHFCCYDVGIPTDLFLYYTSSSFRLMLPSTGNSLGSFALCSLVNDLALWRAFTVCNLINKIHFSSFAVSSFLLSPLPLRFGLWKKRARETPR